MILNFRVANCRACGISAAASAVQGYLQLQGYLDTATEEMEAGTWTGIVGSLLCPARPEQARATIEAVAGEQVIMVTWYWDVDVDRRQ